MQPPVHRETPCHECFKVLIDLRVGNDKVMQIPFDAHEKDLTLGIHVLIQVQDIAAVREYELGN
jgi:hypothetical protein